MVYVVACTQQEVLSGEQSDSGLDSPVMGGVGVELVEVHTELHTCHLLTAQCCNSVHACCTAPMPLVNRVEQDLVNLQ